MKRILFLVTILLMFQSPAFAERLLEWGKADTIDFNLWVPGTGGETPYAGVAPATGDCKLSIDQGSESNTAVPSALNSRWTIALTDTQTQGHHLTIHCKDQDGAAFVEQWVYITTGDSLPNGAIQTCGGSCPDTLSYAKLAATETAADNLLKGNKFTVVKGLGAGQTRRVCGWTLSTKVIQFCAPLTTALDTTSYYALIADAPDITDAEMAQVRDALGVDGTKTAAASGDLQSIASQTTDIKNVTDQFVFTVAGKVNASVRDVAGTNVTDFSGFHDFSTQQGQEINNALGLTGTKSAGSGGELQAVKAKTDGLNFTGSDVKATLDGETVTLADGSFTASKWAADAISAAAISSSADDEIANAIWNLSAGTELATIPGATPSFKEITRWMYEISKHKMTTTNTQQKLYKANGTTVLGTSTVSDVGGVFTRGAYQ